MEFTAKSNIKLSRHVLNTLQELFIQHGCDKIVVAYSGGVDSHVLLHSLAVERHAWELPPEIQAVHIHHGLNSEADQWQKHCQHVCDALSVSYVSVNIDVNQSQGVSLEAEARHSRYQALAQFVEENSVLITAQHQDDQAETLMLQLIRGAGIDGLSAMPQWRPFAKGWQCRPLLTISKQAITAYAKEHALQWIEDSSNADRQYARNYLRHDVLPLLTARWPAVAKTLSRSAQHCADSATLIEQLIQPLWAKVFDREQKTVSIKALLALSMLECDAVIRCYIKTMGFLQPSTQKLFEIQRQLLHARDDASPVVQWGRCEMRRYRDRLYLMPCLTEHDASQRIDWPLTQPRIDLGPLGQLTVVHEQGAGLDVNKLQGRQLSVRFRQGGETIKLAGRQGHHQLKKLFQEFGIPLWKRDRLPLIYADDQLIMVIGIGIHEDFFNSINGFKIEWQPIVNKIETEGYYE